MRLSIMIFMKQDLLEMLIPHHMAKTSLKLLAMLKSLKNKLMLFAHRKLQFSSTKLMTSRRYSHNANSSMRIITVTASYLSVTTSALTCWSTLLVQLLLRSTVSVIRRSSSTDLLLQPESQILNQVTSHLENSQLGMHCSLRQWLNHHIMASAQRSKPITMTLLNKQLNLWMPLFSTITLVQTEPERPGPNGF